MKYMNKFKTVFLVVIILSWSVCGLAYASSKSALLVSVKEFLQPIFSLIFVVCMIYACFFLYSKLNGYNMRKFSKLSKKRVEDSRISLVSHLSLGQNKSVDVIEINGQRLLLGVCADKISLLKEIDSDAEVTPENIDEDLFEIKEFDEDETDLEDKNNKDAKIDELYDKYLRGTDAK